MNCTAKLSVYQIQLKGLAITYTKLYGCYREYIAEVLSDSSY